MAKSDTYSYVLETIRKNLGNKVLQGDLLLQKLRKDLPQFLPARDVQRQERITTHWLLKSSWAYFNDAQEGSICASIENLFYDYYLRIAECLPDMVGKIHYDLHQHFFKPTPEEKNAFLNSVVPLLVEMSSSKKRRIIRLPVTYLGPIPKIDNSLSAAARYGKLHYVFTGNNAPEDNLLKRKLING